MNMNENEYLCFVKHVGDDIDGKHLYEFLFSNRIDEFWGDGFEYFPACVAVDFKPNEEYYNIVKIVKTNIKFILAQNSCCNSFQDCIDHIIPVAYEDITNYDEYPDLRLVLHFGMEYSEVEELLSQKNIIFEADKNER